MMALKHTVRPYGSGSRRTATGEPDRLRIDSDMRLSRVRQLRGSRRTKAMLFMGQDTSLQRTVSGLVVDA
jgi:hypothetical protein